LPAAEMYLVMTSSLFLKMLHQESSFGEKEEYPKEDEVRIPKFPADCF